MVNEKDYIVLDGTMDTVKIEKIFGDDLVMVEIIGDEIYSCESESLFI